MPTLQVGKTPIEYELRRSGAVRERKIVVTPGHVTVLALPSDDESLIAALLDRKREWLFNTVREMDATIAARHTIPRFITGAKIPYRGRKVGLLVRHTDSERTSVTHNNRFVVDLPHWMGLETDELVASELQHWLKQRARRDVTAIVAELFRKFGLTPASLRVGELANAWDIAAPKDTLFSTGSRYSHLARSWNMSSPTNLCNCRCGIILGVFGEGWLAFCPTTLSPSRGSS